MATLERLQVRPDGVFKGENFITPEAVAYFKREYRGSVVYVEISRGTGMYNEPLWGCTFRRDGGGELWREGENADPSGCFGSEAEAIERAETA